MSRRALGRVLLLVGAMVGLAVSWSAERVSLQRGNRLHRAGSVDRAAELYEERVRRGAGDEALRYNLGTALAELDDPAAEVELEIASRRGDAELRSRAQYNAGLLRLERALEAGAPDSVRLQASAAAEANRASLRLRPDNEDAKWNLAMALRLMDSIDAIERRSGRELTDGAMEADVVTRSVNVPDAAEDEFAEDPPAEGENEAVALATDEEPLSPEEAEELLGRTHLDPTEMIGKLLALESRSRWGLRSRRGIRRW
jgi:hypothetical protein